MATRRQIHRDPAQHSDLAGRVRVCRVDVIGAYVAYPCHFRSTFQVMASVLSPARARMCMLDWAGTRPVTPRLTQRKGLQHGADAWAQSPAPPCGLRCARRGVRGARRNELMAAGDRSGAPPMLACAVVSITGRNGEGRTRDVPVMASHARLGCRRRCVRS